MLPDEAAGTAGPPPGYGRMPVPLNAPAVASAPVNGAIAPRMGPIGPVTIELGQLTRWIFEHALDAGAANEPLRYSADSEHAIVTVTFAELDDLLAWGRRFRTDRPARLPADQHVGQVVQTQLARGGWTIIFRVVETPPVAS